MAIGIGALVLVGILAAVALTWVLTSSTPPPTPGNLRATETEDAVNLDWDSVSGADHYSVYRDSSRIADEVSLTTYVDRPGNTNTHVYAVTAVDANGDESKRSTTVTGSPKQGPSTGPSSPQPPSGNLTAAQQALVDRLPDAIDSGSCKPNPSAEDATFTDAAVKCDLSSGTTSGTTPATIYVGHDRSATAYNNDLAAFAKKINLPKRLCSTPPAQGTWGPSTNVSEKVGSLFCYPSSDKKATLLWTYDKDRIHMRAVADDADIPSLFAWWKAAPISLR